MASAKKIALALLAGSAVVAAGLTLQFTGVAAQDRATVQATSDNHRAVRYVETPDGDGGTARRDLWQEAADACTAAERAFESDKERHIATGAPSIEALKQQRTAAKAVCDDYRTRADSVRVARAIYEGADQAYDCEHLDGPCPDGGSDGG